MAAEWPFFFIQQIIKYASDCIFPLLFSRLLSLEEAHNLCCSHGRSMLCTCGVNGHFILIQQIIKYTSDCIVPLLCSLWFSLWEAHTTPLAINHTSIMLQKMLHISVMPFYENSCSQTAVHNAHIASDSFISCIWLVQQTGITWMQKQFICNYHLSSQESLYQRFVFFLRDFFFDSHFNILHK